MARTDTPDRPLRADAERNRQRILGAASRVFAERGLDVSLDDLAAAAGVGVGTIYRRFPDKDALIDALFEDKLRAMVDLAHACLEIEDPWTALATFLREMCRQSAEDRGLKEVLLRQDGGERVRRTREAIAPLGNRILSRAREAGVVRDDVVGTDMPLIHFAVGFVSDRTRDVAPDAWERVVTLVLDGLAVRRDAPTPMTAPALAPEQLGAALAGRR